MASRLIATWALLVDPHSVTGCQSHGRVTIYDSEVRSAVTVTISPPQGACGQPNTNEDLKREGGDNGPGLNTAQLGHLLARLMIGRFGVQQYPWVVILGCEVYQRLALMTYQVLHSPAVRRLRFHMQFPSFCWTESINSLS